MILTMRLKRLGEKSDLIYHFVQHISYVDSSGIEPGPQRLHLRRHA